LLPKVDANAIAPCAEQDAITVAFRTLPQADGVDPHCALGPQPPASWQTSAEAGLTPVASRVARSPVYSSQIVVWGVCGWTAGTAEIDREGKIIVFVGSLKSEKGQRSSPGIDPSAEMRIHRAEVGRFQSLV
jgi:hypothetical protein